MAWPYLYAQNLENSPWLALRRLQEEMNDWFDGSSFTAPAQFPAINVWGDSEKLVAHVELAGVAAGDVEVTVNGNILHIAGERRAGPQQAESTLHRSEREFGKFNRSIELPYRVDSGSVEARFKDGVLSVTLPRLPEEKPRKIEIN